MIISNLTYAVFQPPPTSHRSGTAAVTGRTEGTDQVDISRQARGAGSGGPLVHTPAALVNEEQIKTNLLGILMDTLFGSETEKKKETAEAELVRTTVEEPAANAALDALVGQATQTTQA